jgi:hypothetical protein
MMIGSVASLVAKYKSTKETGKVDCTAKPVVKTTSGEQVKQIILSSTNPIDAYKVNESGIVVGKETGGM